MKWLIIATKATDRLITDDGMLIREGGPGHFITRVFEKEGENFSTVRGTHAIIDIDMHEKLEKGRVVHVKPITYKKKCAALIVSTVADEFPLQALGKISCIDVQGYVRGKDFGYKQDFDSPEIEKFTVVKGTKQELSHIQNSRLKNIPIVIETNGEEGFSVTHKGKKKKYSVERLFPQDTIGAGDTLFAAFCLAFGKTGDVESSALFARKTVQEFLRTKVKL